MTAETEKIDEYGFESIRETEEVLGFSYKEFKIRLKAVKRFCRNRDTTILTNDELFDGLNKELERIDEL